MRRPSSPKTRYDEEILKVKLPKGDSFQNVSDSDQGEAGTHVAQGRDHPFDLEMDKQICHQMFDMKG